MPATATPTAEPLKVGTNHERVGHLQNRLAALGHGTSPDGTFGPKTHAAVSAFQMAHGLTVDGVVGPKTTEALRNGDALKQAAHDEEEAAKAAGAKPAAKGAAKGAAKPAAKDAAASASKRYARKIEIDDKGLVRVYYREGAAPADAAAGGLAEAAEVGKPGTNWKAVGPEAKKRIGPIVRHYMKDPHPFTSCVNDNTKRFGPDRAKRICAVVKDLGMKTTKWRKGPKTVSESDFIVGVVRDLVEAGIRDAYDLDLVESYLMAELGSRTVWLDESAPATHRHVIAETLQLEEANAGWEAMIAKLVAAGLTPEQAQAVAAKGIGSKSGGGKHRGGDRTVTQVHRLPNGNFAPKGTGTVLTAGSKIVVPSQDGKKAAPATVGEGGKFKLDAGTDKGWEGTLGAPAAKAAPKAAPVPKPAAGATAWDKQPNEWADSDLAGLHIQAANKLVTAKLNKEGPDGPLTKTWGPRKAALEAEASKRGVKLEHGAEGGAAKAIAHKASQSPVSGQAPGAKLPAKPTAAGNAAKRADIKAKMAAQPKASGKTVHGQPVEPGHVLADKNGGQFKVAKVDDKGLHVQQVATSPGQKHLDPNDDVGEQAFVVPHEKAESTFVADRPQPDRSQASGMNHKLKAMGYTPKAKPKPATTSTSGTRAPGDGGTGEDLMKFAKPGMKINVKGDGSKWGIADGEYEVVTAPMQDTNLDGSPSGHGTMVTIKRTSDGAAVKVGAKDISSFKPVGASAKSAAAKPKSGEDTKADAMRKKAVAEDKGHLQKQAAASSAPDPWKPKAADPAAASGIDTSEIAPELAKKYGGAENVQMANQLQLGKLKIDDVPADMREMVARVLSDGSKEFAKSKLTVYANKAKQLSELAAKLKAAGGG